MSGPSSPGSPRPPFTGRPCERMETTPEATLVLGDRLDTDILGGVRLGMPTVLLLTGISQRDELADSPISPSLVLEDLPTLASTWRAACAAPDTARTDNE